MSVLTNLGRTAARAVGGLALDASNGVLTAASSVKAAATDSRSVRRPCGCTW